MIRLGGVALALCLAGCEPPPTTTRVVAQCDLEAQRVFAAATNDRASMMDPYFTTCMTARGYKWSGGPGCPAWATREAANLAACYSH